MTAAKYANQQIKNGSFPSMTIVAGESGTFWLGDADYRSFEGGCFTNRDRAEAARSKAITQATNRYA